MATNWNAILSNTNNLQDVLSILKKVLAQLDIKADITTVDEALLTISQLDQEVTEKLLAVTQALVIFEAHKDEVFDDFESEANALIQDIENQGKTASQDLKEAIDIALAAGAGAAGWTDSLIQAESGLTQRVENRAFVSSVSSVSDFGSIFALDKRIVFLKDGACTGLFQFNASDSSTVSDGGIYIRDSQNRLWTRLDFDVIKPQYYGITESTADATELLRAMHATANKLDLRVSYSGLKSLNVQANAKIILNSDIDFCFCEFKLLNAVKSSLSWNEPFNELFIVYDENYPLQDMELNSSNLQEWYKGSLSFGRYTVFDGYLKLTYNNILFPNRADDGIKPLSLEYCLNHGMATQGLEIDSRSLVSGITAKVRLSPDKRIFLDKFLCDLNEPNKQTLFRIKRNRVVLDASWTKTTDQDCINTLLFVDDAADTLFLNIEGRGSDNISNTGTYALYTFGAAHVRVKRMTSHLGWGQIATHFTNDIRLDNVVSRRIDAHEQVFNFKGRGLKLSNAIQYGNGGGDWFFEDVDFSLNPNATTLDIIAARSDYGKHFIGKITVRDVIFNCLDSTFAKLVNFQNMGAASMISSLPDVEIDGLTINVTQTDTNADTFANRFSFIHLTVDGVKQAKIFKNVKIQNVVINAFDGFKYYALLNFGMYLKNSNSPLEIKNVNSANSCVFQPNLINNRLGSSVYSTAKLSLENFSKNIKIDFNSADSGIKDYFFNNCFFIKCATTQQDWPINFAIKNCIVDYVNTSNKLCGPSNAATSTRDYSMLDCIIIGDPDLSKISIFGNTAVRKYTLSGTAVSTTPLLPPGVLIDDLMKGWRDSSWYK